MVLAKPALSSNNPDWTRLSGKKLPVGFGVAGSAPLTRQHDVRPGFSSGAPTYIHSGCVHNSCKNYERSLHTVNHKRSFAANISKRVLIADVCVLIDKFMK